ASKVVPWTMISALPQRSRSSASTQSWSPGVLARTFTPLGTPLGPLAATASGRGAADGEAVDQHARLADADRHALAVLAAGADALVELHVVADHRDAGERIRPVADQHRALDRRTDLAVLDQVRFGGVEHELARGDVDLAAAEIDRVEPALDRADDLVR